MDPYWLPDGSLHAPYFVCIRRPELDDLALLDRLGVGGVEPVSAELELWDPHLFVIHDRDWVQVADNWRYLLWHSRRFRARVDALAGSHELFTWWIGDADNSYGFSYHRDGRLVRERAGDDDRRTPLRTTVDYGEPLSGEPQPWPDHADDIRPELLHGIAEALGINPRQKGAPICCYSFDPE